MYDAVTLLTCYIVFFSLNLFRNNLSNNISEILLWAFIQNQFLCNVKGSFEKDASAINIHH